MQIRELINSRGLAMSNYYDQENKDDPLDEDHEIDYSKDDIEINPVWEDELRGIENE